MTQDDFAALCAPHLAWLRRWFAFRGIDAAECDDLVQETVTVAWGRRDQLYDPDGLRPWLGAIAGNMMRRWHREHARRQRIVGSSFHSSRDQYADDPSLATGDALCAIEQQEIRAILHAALRHLSSSDRELLLARYGEDLSVAAVGVQHGTSAAHAAVRLHRARQRLRTILETTYPAELAALGLVTASPAWRSTRLWCPHCGADHLRMELDSRQGAFALACPSCCTAPGHYLYNWRLVDADRDANPLRSARTPAEALDRTVRRSAWDLPRRGEQRHCPACAGPVRIRARFPDEAPRDLAHLQLVMSCPTCGPLDASATFGGMVTFHPDGLAFWRAMGRVQTRPPVLARFDQRDAVRVDLVSVGTAEARAFFIDASGERLLAMVADA